MRQIIWSSEFTRLVNSFGGVRAIDRALEPVLDALTRNPYGFEKYENDFTSFRVVRVKAVPGETQPLVIVFTIDTNKDVCLEWIDEEVPF